MAKSISNEDARRVLSLVSRRLPDPHPPRSVAPNRSLTGDNWEILVGGWHQKEGWSRGFMVGDHLRFGRGSIYPRHDGGKYEGAGWHARMANDIVTAVEVLRAEDGAAEVRLEDAVRTLSERWLGEGVRAIFSELIDGGDAKLARRQIVAEVIGDRFPDDFPAVHRGWRVRRVLVDRPIVAEGG